MEINFKTVQKCVNRFKGKSARIDNLLSDNEILRMTFTASRIPIAPDPKVLLVDIGGSVLWLPIYKELLGYKEVVILCRPNAGFTSVFKKEEIGIEKGFNVEILDCDAELGKYPIDNGQASCVVAFEILEHFAGDPMNLVAESNRILKENGYLCLTTPNVISSQNLLRHAFGQQPYAWSVFTDSFADRHNREYTPFEVRKLLEAGGFEASQLETFSCVKQKILPKLLGGLLSFPAFLMRKVPLRMRNATIFVCANKTGQVLHRYPTFMYDLFGANKVQVKIPLKYLSSTIEDSKEL